VKLYLVAAMSAAAVVAAGCTAPWRDGSSPSCALPAEPVTEETLVATLGRHGFELTREPCVPGELQPTATFTNLTDEAWNTPEGDVIWASDGSVSCWLNLGASPSRLTAVSRIPDDGIVYLGVLNVECGIQESNPRQVERLKFALEQFLPG
jgi:hypothetical protein